MPGVLRVTSDVICNLLRARYRPLEWILAFGVANGTGASAQRTADAVAMNCFPSKGLELLGFEIKVSRSDWLRELKDSTKSVPVADYCDRWYIVAPDGVVKREELPKAWGLLVARADDLRVVVNVPPREDVKPITRTFMASMLRNIAKAEDAVIKAAESVARAAGYEEGHQRAQNGYDHTGMKQRLTGLQETVRKFEEVSGISLDREWNLGAVGAKVHALRNADQAAADARRLAVRLRRNADDIDREFPPTANEED